MHNAGWKELPMPRGSELYSPVSQALLRAARIGQVNRPQPTPPEDEKEPGEDDDEGDVDTGYVAMKWSQVPKEMEEPEMEFLAKRRKGLSSVYGVLVRPSTTASQMRKVKVKRVDAEGHVNVWDVLVPEGTVMEGETVEGDEVMTEAPAPGTVVEGVGIANAEGVVIAGDQVMPTPPRRRPPPPKRKAKGPGRGRRKRPLGTDGAVRTNGTVQSKETTREGTFSTAVDVKGTDEAEARIKTEEIGLGDYSIIQDGDEGSEEDEDEGDDGEDGDREEGELSPTPDIDAPGSISGPATRPLPASAPDVAEPVPAEETHNGLMNVVPPPISRDPSSSPDLPLAAVQSLPFPDMTVGPASELAYPAPAFSAPPGNAKAVEDVTVEDHEFIRFHAAEIPDEHIPREGLAAPQLLEANGQARLIQNQTDFLGSLERHLDQNS
ncbi:hypothetical protein MMC13_003242 [Lambiella insularis]|nr:hypothetical protein [Lambiella insularis]